MTRYSHLYARCRGSVAIYITLLVILVITSSAIVLSSILTKQLRSSLDILASERAFYGANSGLEHTRYLLHQKIEALQPPPTISYEELFEPVGAVGSIEYEGGRTVQFNARGQFVQDPGNPVIVAQCVFSEAEHVGQERRVVQRARNVDCPF